MPIFQVRCLLTALPGTTLSCRRGAVEGGLYEEVSKVGMVQDSAEKGFDLLIEALTVIV